MTIEFVENAHNDQDFLVGAETNQQLWDMEDRHFWHAARNRWINLAIKDFAIQPVETFLEVGCGSGAVSRSLVNQGISVTGIDISEPLINKAHQRLPNSTFVVGRLENLPDSVPQLYDGVGMFDVLEHLDEPEKLLKQAIGHVKKAGIFVATVPAMQDMYTIIDTLSGHKKRYNPGEMSALFESCGLTEVREFGIFRSTRLFQVIRSAIIGSSSSQYDHAKADSAEYRAKVFAKTTVVPPSIINKGFNMLCKIEQKMFWKRAQNKPGASILAIGIAKSN